MVLRSPGVLAVQINNLIMLSTKETTNHNLVASHTGVSFSGTKGIKKAKHMTVEPGRRNCKTNHNAH